MTRKDDGKYWAVFTLAKGEGETWQHEISVETREDADTERDNFYHRGYRVRLKYILPESVQEVMAGWNAGIMEKELRIKEMKIYDIVKGHKGSIFAGVLAKDDVIYFKVSKREALIHMSAEGADNQFDISYNGDDLYIDRAE